MTSVIATTRKAARQAASKQNQKRFLSRRPRGLRLPVEELLRIASGLLVRHNSARQGQSGKSDQRRSSDGGITEFGSLNSSDIVSPRTFDIVSPRTFLAQGTTASHCQQHYNNGECFSTQLHEYSPRQYFNRLQKKSQYTVVRLNLLFTRLYFAW